MKAITTFNTTIINFINSTFEVNGGAANLISLETASNVNIPNKRGIAGQFTTTNGKYTITFPILGSVDTGQLSEISYIQFIIERNASNPNSLKDYIDETKELWRVVGPIQSIMPELFNDIVQ